MKVFLSHTSEFRNYPKEGDLTYIGAVERAISAAGHVIVDMADFPAADKAPADVCIGRVRECDVYVGVFGTRYGSPVRDQPEVSYTELEFDTATEAGIPQLVFQLDEEAENPGIPAKWLKDTPYGTRQEEFLKRVREGGLTLNTFANPHQLSQLVERSLNALAKPAPTERAAETKHNLPALPLDPSDWPGRAGDLERLLALLMAPGSAVVIRGMDGVGKSSLALHAGHVLRGQGGWQAICCLEAREGGERMAQQLVQFAASRLDLSAPQELDLAARLTWCLEHWPGAPAPVLLLLDDLSDAQVLQRLATGLPERFRCLITTRLRLEGTVQELELAPLESGDAVLVLERRSGREPFAGKERAAAQAIAAEVGGLPLALTLLGRQLRRDPDLALATLQRRLEEKGALAEVLQTAAPELLVQQGLKAGFELVEAELTPVAREMALTLGELAQAAVPRGLLDPCRPPAITEVAWEEARSELINGCLLERLQPGVYRLHPLLHDLLAHQSAQGPEAQALRQRRLAAAVAGWSRQMPQLLDAGERELWLPCLAQLERAAARPADRFPAGEAGWPALALGRFLSAEGLYGPAMTRLKAALERAEAEDERAGACRAGGLEATTEIQREWGELEQAELNAREALALREAAGSEDADLAGALTALGLVLHARGESENDASRSLDEAEMLLRQALEIRCALLPQGDEEVLAGHNNLGRTLASQGKEQEAMRLYEEALHAAAGRCSHTTVVLHNNLANVHRGAGRKQEAMEHLEQAAAQAETALGPRHPDRGLLLRNLAVLEEEEKLHEEARQHGAQALAILEEAFGKEAALCKECRSLLESLTGPSAGS